MCATRLGDGDDWLHSSQLSSDINAFNLKKNQKISISGFVGMGAFIWEDNIAGRIFPYGTMNRHFELEDIYDE